MGPGGRDGAGTAASMRGHGDHAPPDGAAELDDRQVALREAAQRRLDRLSNYHRWILDQFASALGRRVWDSSAGRGQITARLARTADLVLATEYSRANLEALEAAFGSHPNVQVRRCDFSRPDLDELRAFELDTVVSVDVLEHLEDDAAVLRVFAEVLVPGGRVCVKVPAHPALYSVLDERVGHHRRYTRADLATRLDRAGLEVLRCRYMNAAAVLPYYLRGRARRRDRDGDVSFSGSLSEDRVGFYNRLVPALARIERLVPPPFGLSVVAVAAVPERTSR